MKIWEVLGNKKTWQNLVVLYMAVDRQTKASLSAGKKIDVLS